MSHFTVQVTWDDEEPVKREVARVLAQVVGDVEGVTRTKVYSSEDGQLLADVFSEDDDSEVLTFEQVLADVEANEDGAIEPDSLLTFTILAIVVGALAYFGWHVIKAGTFWS